jgi:8-oxo-dGTP pyrophosphatase MutT (NUDIX family)
MVFDPVGRVLLIRFVIERSGGTLIFWLTPGGEIEPGETPLEAATRELREEVGLEVPLAGPVREQRNQFEFEGEMQDNTDYFFHAECGVNSPKLVGFTAQEIRLMKEMRWWSAEEIEASGEQFYPVDLAEWVRRVWGTCRG